jgi:thiol-disulfide isomerase/thioredoxin
MDNPVLPNNFQGIVPKSNNNLKMLFIAILFIAIIGISLYYAKDLKGLIPDLPGDHNVHAEEKDVHAHAHDHSQPSQEDVHTEGKSDPATIPSDASTSHGKDVLESFVAQNLDKDLCDKPRFVNSQIVGDYELSAKVISKRGNSCLKNCVTDKDHDFVTIGDMPKGGPTAIIDTDLEYSNFDAICKEPAQNYCEKNAQVISKYSPGGILMEDQNKNNLTTNSGLGLNSAIVSNNVKHELSNPGNEHGSGHDNVEHFASGGALELVLIVFLASWCPHCKSAKPAIDRFKKTHHGNKMDNAMIKVEIYDADDDPEVIKKYKVNGFPTYKLLVKHKDGTEKVHDHDGGRLFDDLVSLCKKYL